MILDLIFLLSFQYFLYFVSTVAAVMIGADMTSPFMGCVRDVTWDDVRQNHHDVVQNISNVILGCNKEDYCDDIMSCNMNGECTDVWIDHV